MEAIVQALLSIARALNWRKPSGSMFVWPGVTAPADFLLCDGASYLRVDYPDLFVNLGGTSSPWGLPDSTHFNVPDMRGYFPVGKKTSDANFDVLNIPTTYVGEKSHALITAELAAHLHNLDGEASQYYAGGDDALGGPYATRTSGGKITKTTNTGSGTAHNTIPPYRVINWIIKI